MADLQASGPADRNAAVKAPPWRWDGRQIERAMGSLLWAGVAGGVLLAIGTASRLNVAPTNGASSASPAIDFLVSGALAALAAAAAGAALGLLFGLPLSRPSAVGAIGTDSHRDWYDDSTAMEQIADWLTKIIVGVSLTQWSSATRHFDRLAGATAGAMGVAASDGGKLVGGAILLGYAVLGFLLAYLWARRYLRAEFTTARADSRAQQEQAEERSRLLIDRASAAGTVQGPRQDGMNKDRAAEEVERVASRDGPLAPVLPGKRADDPWFGQFGGKAVSDRATLSATVEPLATQPGLFGVTVRLVGNDTTGRQALAGERVRLYLHPTFPDFIREIVFDGTGEVRLPLVAYGCFTVGAQLADDHRLELRLCDDPAFPDAFRSH